MELTGGMKAAFITFGEHNRLLFIAVGSTAQGVLSIAALPSAEGSGDCVSGRNAPDKGVDR